MDVRFLGEVCEAFIIKNSLYDKCKADVLREELLELVREVRETDIELYDHLYDTGRLQQQKILETYLNYQYLNNGNNETLEEMVIDPLTLNLTVGGISALLTLIYQNRINKSIFGAGRLIGKAFESVGNFLTKHGRYWKFRYAIIQQNAKKCYVKCGITEKDLSAWSYLSVGSSPPTLATTESHRQGECLKECYVSHSIEAIALLSKSYFACLKKSGDWNSVREAKPDDILTMLSGLQISTLCQSYYTEMKKAMDSFTDLLDFVYGRTDPEKTRAMKELKSKVIESRKEIERTNNMNRFN